MLYLAESAVKPDQNSTPLYFPPALPHNDLTFAMENNWREVDQLVGELLDLPENEARSRLEHGRLAPEIRRRAEELLQAWHDSEDFLDDPPILSALRSEPDRRLGARLDSWQLSSVIGSGGMGTVYLANRADRDFTQQAAVKVIAAGRLSRSSERRFREERQILARLEHPHVARLIDGGVAPDGSPYLVMEYVEGTPIDAWARGVDLRDRLRMFHDVCLAVQFAHQNLVIHCDLKPANILVTREGAPKLLDFGIARFLERQGEETRTLLHPMTPDYASPEQVRGLQPGTSSDIYSLGVMLYELATGRRPYQLRGKPLDEVLATVCESEIEKPSTGSVDLDAIIWKALQKETQRRYQSVDKLAEDIERYLEGRPVSAQPDTFFYRARKFASRRALPLAAVCAVLVVAGAGVFSTVAQSRRAERRFNDVRALAHSLLFDLYDSISALPGSLPARRQVVSRAQQYLDSLSREANGDSTLTRELVESYRRLALVRGAPYAANLGDSAGALESLRKAQALMEAEAVRYPNDPAVQRTLTIIYGAAGTIMVRQQDPGAVDLMHKYVQAAEALRAKFPTDPANVLNLSRAYLDLGLALAVKANQSKSVEDFQQVLDNYQKSVEIQEALGPSPDPDNQTKLAPKYFYVGYALRDLGDRTGDVTYYQRALEVSLKGFAIYNELASADPTLLNRRNVADGLSDIGLLRWKCCRQLTGALRDLEEARKNFEGIAAGDAQNLEARRDVADVNQKIGLVLAESGRREGALATNRKALALYQELGRADPTSGENAGYIKAILARIAALERGE
jgi:non-specific serine/threonine protein kinase/serine/threonine-protein kinase